MTYKRAILATLLSLPLLPFLLVPESVFSQFVTKREIILAAPFVLELMGFYAICPFVNGVERALTEKERQALLVLAVGMFVLLGLPVVWGGLSDLSSTHIKVTFLLAMAYALFSLVSNVRQMSRTLDAMSRYFSQRYAIPASLAATIGALPVVLFHSASTINPIVAYFILKNFTLMSE